MPEAKTKARGRTRGRAPTNEGSVRAPIALVRGETRVPLTARWMGQQTIPPTTWNPATLGTTFRRVLDQMWP